jgi:hypothetical protein
MVPSYLSLTGQTAGGCLTPWPLHGTSMGFALSMGVLCFSDILGGSWLSPEGILQVEPEVSYDLDWGSHGASCLLNPSDHK